MNISEIYMSRCLELAAHGRGRVAPNPLVGAVIVADGYIIGEGYHRFFGGAHAEMEAIASVKDEAMLRRSTIYVNLEPCSHYGKTSSCAELIIQKAIPQVVVACSDPNPKVAGKGIKILREKGIEVKTGVMEWEALLLNRSFMTAYMHHRPYIILKWAQSEDGFIDAKRNDASEKPFVFSTSITRMMAHRLRSEVQAVMVGTNTAVLDNPMLSVRAWKGRAPIRILIDRERRVSYDNHLFDDKQKTFVFTKKSPVQLADTENIRYFASDDSGLRLRAIMKKLYENEIHSLLVEGGAQLHRSFLEDNLWDELIIETAPTHLKEGVRSAFSLASKTFQLTEKQYVYSGKSGGEKPSKIEIFKNYTF